MAPKTIDLFLKSRLYRDNIRLLAGITLFFWCWMLVYAFCFYRPVYTSDAWVMIKDSAITSGYVQAETYVAEKTTSSNAANPVLNTMGLLSSARIMEALYEFLAKRHPQELARIGIKTRQDWQNFYKDGSAVIKAKNKAGTDLISVQVTWTDPALAQQMAVVALDAFQRASQDLNQEEQRNRRRYLEDEVAKLEKKLEGVRSRKSAFKRNNNTVDADRESLELTRLRMGFETRLNETLAAAEGRQAEMNRYQKMLGMTADQALKASAVGMNPTVSRLKNELYELSETHAYLSSNLTDRNPKVKEVRARIDQVEKDLGSELRQTLGAKSASGGRVVADAPRASVVGQLVSAQAETIRLNQEARALRKRLGVIDASIRQFPSVEEGLTNIEQAEKSLSNSLDALRNKLTEARLKEAQTLSNVFIVDGARLPLKSNFPSQTDLALLSLVVGLLLGLAVVAARYYFRLDERLPRVARRAAALLEQGVAPPPAGQGEESPESFEKALDDIFAPRVYASPGDFRRAAASQSPESLRQRLSDFKRDYSAGLTLCQQIEEEIATGDADLRQRERALSANGGDDSARAALLRERQALSARLRELKRQRQGLENRAALIRRLELFLGEASPASDAQPAPAPAAKPVALATPDVQAATPAAPASFSRKTLSPAASAHTDDLKRHVLMRYLRERASMSPPPLTLPPMSEPHASRLSIVPPRAAS